jgi:hypothetical protein
MPLEGISGKAAQAEDARVRTPVMLEVPEGENRVSIFAIVQVRPSFFHFMCCLGRRAP